MISVNEAFKIVKENAFVPSISTVPLLESLGLILAENIIADRDFPPFNRVAMDGVAIAHSTFRGGNPSNFDIEKWMPFIEDTQYAGETQKQLSKPKNCIEVMTGAVLPLGCEAVVRYEDLEIEEFEGSKYAKFLISQREIKDWQNVHPKGSDRKAGDVLLKKGLKISPPEIAVMASVGKDKVLVENPPRIAVISTGDELVEITTNPELYQIRMSNSYMLAGALAQV